MMSAGVALALFNAMIASTLMGGRQLYSSGRDRAWPRRLSNALAQLHPGFNSPWIATLVLGATSLLWCLVKLQLLVVLIGDGTAAIYACMCLASLRSRRRGGTLPPYRMALFPLSPVIGLIALAGVGLADLFDANGRVGLLSSVMVVIVSAGYYGLVAGPSGWWAHRGPGMTA